MRAGLARALLYKSYGLASGDRPLRRGGANNRADRVSHYLTRRQVEDIIVAADYAEAMGWAFSRHWSVHLERAGIPDSMGAAFVTRLLDTARRYLKRRGAELVAIWVRENSPESGSHVHILLHLSKPVNLRNLTRKWIVAAGGTYRRRVSKMRTIGGRLDVVGANPAHYWANADAVLSYVLKGCSEATGKALGLERFGKGGEIIGKRAGCSQGIGPQARQTATWSCSKNKCLF